MVCAGELLINRKGKDVVKDLNKFEFMKFGDTSPPRTGFEYLLTMQIASLTNERKKELERMAKEKATELKRLSKTKIQDMWLEDLNNLEDAIHKLYAEEAEDDEGKGKTGNKGKAAKKASKRKGKSGGDEEDAVDGDRGDEDAAIDPMDNFFGDISRWTRGALKVTSGCGDPMKRRDEAG